MYHSVNVIFKNHCMFIVKYIYDSLFSKMSIYAIERNFKGTYSSVEMQKGYMVKERLGDPALNRPSLHATRASYAITSFYRSDILMIICLHSKHVAHIVTNVSQ